MQEVSSIKFAEQTSSRMAELAWSETMFEQIKTGSKRESDPRVKRPGTQRSREGSSIAYHLNVE